MGMCFALPYSVNFLVVENFDKFDKLLLNFPYQLKLSWVIKTFVDLHKVFHQFFTCQFTQIVKIWHL